MVKAQQSRGQDRRAPPDSRKKTAKEDKLMRISGTTTLLGLIGTPVEHSKSPAMYNHCFQKFGLDWAYLAFDIHQEKAGDAVRAIRTLGMRGANVTMPCKSAVIPYLDKLSPEAQAIGAVNVIVNDGGVLTGYNTDGMGYTGDLRRNGIEIAGKKVTLLGGGGAASAIAIQAALEEQEKGLGYVIDCTIEEGELVRPMVNGGTHITEFLVN